MDSDTQSGAPLLATLRSVPSGFLSDAFGRLGLQGRKSGLHCTKNGLERCVAGPAVTVQIAPVRGKPGAGQKRCRSTGCCGKWRPGQSSSSPRLTATATWSAATWAPPPSGPGSGRW